MKNKLMKLDYLNIVLTFFSIFFVYFKFKSIKITIISACIIIPLAIFIYFINKKLSDNKIKLEYVYLIVAFILGLGFLIFLPPQRVPDARSDYLRSLEVSKFHFVTPMQDGQGGDYYPKNVQKVYRLAYIKDTKYKDYKEISDLKLDGAQSFFTYSNKAMYLFLTYLPQAFGVGVGRALHLSIYYQSLLGKLCNYLFFMLLIFLSIKFIPFKKELVMFIALMPITIQEAISLAPDSMTMGVSICFISFLIYFMNRKQIMDIKEKVFLLILAILLSACKIVYVPLCLLAFFLPNECFANKKRKYIYCIILCGLSLLINLSWLVKASEYLAGYQEKTNSLEQLKFLLKYPVNYFVVMFTTVDYYLLSWIKQLFGLSIGIYDIKSSPLILVSSMYLLIYYVVHHCNSKKEYLLSIGKKIFTIFIIVCTIVLIFTSLYIEWTPLQASHIDGIQGRYFIPLILVTAMIFMNKNNKKENIDYRNLITYSFMCNIVVFISIIFFFV